MPSLANIKSAILPWRRGQKSENFSEPLMDMSQPNTLADGAHESSPAVEQSAEVKASATFPWRRPLANEAGSARSCATTTSECSLTSADSQNRLSLTLEDAGEVSEVKKSFPWRRPLAKGNFPARQVSTISTSSSCAAGLTESSSESQLTPSEAEDIELPVASPTSVSRHGLKISSDSWAAALKARRQKARQGEDALSHEEIVRNMKSILNKLTFEKFPALCKQLILCGIKTTSHLEALTHEICEKAITQHHFVNMYADLCAVLQAHFASQGTTLNFKKILLNACQSSFEKHQKAPIWLKTLEGEELAAAEQLYKLQMLGNIKFVGALIVRKMLSLTVMFAIIEELLNVPTSEALESLAAFLTAVGPNFDQPSFPHQFLFDAIFDRVEAMTKDSHVKNRVRYLLKDVLDLRASCWQDHKAKKNESPSTLQEVARKFRTDTKGTPKSCAQPSNNLHVEKSMVAQSTVVPPGVRPACNPIDERWMQLRQGLQKSPVVEFPFQERHTEDKPLSPSTPSSKTDKLSASGEQSTNDVEHKLIQFFKDNIVDDEAACDLKACPIEIQEMVLAKGSVTDANNSSALLRVRMNQAWREFKKTGKAVELVASAKASPEQCKAVPPKKEQSKKKKAKTIDAYHAEKAKASEAHQGATAKASEAHQDTRAKASEAHQDQTAQASEAHQDKTIKAIEDHHDNYLPSVCHAEMVAAFAELLSSHDIAEAATRISSVAVPPPLQPKGFFDFIAHIVEQVMDSRTWGFKLIVALFNENYWTHAALQEGLQIFESSMAELELDVPTLPKIVSEEMGPAFQTLVAKGILSGEQLRSLSDTCGQ